MTHPALSLLGLGGKYFFQEEEFDEHFEKHTNGRGMDMWLDHSHRHN